MDRKTIFSRRMIVSIVFSITFLFLNHPLHAQIQNTRSTATNAAIAAAKKEGKISVYASYGYEEAAKIHEAFQKKYPFIKFEHASLRAGDVVTRALSEYKAGSHNVDVLGTGGATFTPLVEAGILQEVDWASLGITKDAIDGPTRVTVATIIYPIGYNTKYVSAHEAPKTYADLMDPKWKGKIVLWGSPFGFAELIPELGEDYVMKLLKGVMANNPIVIRGSGEAAATLGSGAAYVTFSVNRREQRKLMRKGAPISYNWGDPIPFSRYDFAVAKKAANPNASKLFIAWLASPEGLAVYEKIFGRGNIFIPDSEVAKETQGKRFSTHAFDKYKERTKYVKQLRKIVTP